jgi:hypothetical protein
MIDADAVDHGDAELIRAPAQRCGEITVEDHVGEGLARLDFAIEGKEDGTDRIGGARVGDDHLRHRVRLGLDLLPAANRVEHAHGSSGDGDRAAILLPDPAGGCIDDGNRHARAGLRDGCRYCEAHIARTCDDHVETVRVFCHRPKFLLLACSLALLPTLRT